VDRPSLGAGVVEMEFFIAHATKDGDLHVLPSFHFPTADEARSKILELRRTVEVNLEIVEIGRDSAVTLCSAA
jgi:hypothetical protein